MHAVSSFIESDHMSLTQNSSNDHYRTHLGLVIPLIRQILEMMFYWVNYFSIISNILPPTDEVQSGLECFHMLCKQLLW